MSTHTIKQLRHATHSAHRYRWEERHEIFKAAAQVTLDEHEGLSFAHFLGLLMLAGLRIDEVREMRWDIPTSEEQEWPWPDLKSWQIVMPVVGRQNKRLVPIIPQLARLLFYWPLPKQGPLFPFQITDEQVANHWRETVDRAGVKFVQVNALRITYAAMMSDVFGLSPTEIANILDGSKLKRPTTRRAIRKEVA